MKVVVVASRKEDAKPEEFAPHLEKIVEILGGLAPVAGQAVPSLRGW